MRDGDPGTLGPLVCIGDEAPAEVLRCAESLGIPWARILMAEIETEQRLRRYLSDLEDGCSLSSALTILSFSFLQSWRVRDQIQSLAARAGEDAGSVRQLRSVFRRMTEGADRGAPALAEHLWFAYQRVLLLQRVSRVASRSRGSTAERVAFVCRRTKCCYEDATWAVSREEARDNGSRLDAAVRRVREEGFLIPRARTEARSLAELRRLVRGFPKTSPGSARASSAYPVSVPRRVDPSDAIGTASR